MDLMDWWGKDLMLPDVHSIVGYCTGDDTRVDGDDSDDDGDDDGGDDGGDAGVDGNDMIETMTMWKELICTSLFWKAFLFHALCF